MVTGREARRLEREDSMKGALKTVELYFERGWTDGLPIVPPAEERVQEMVAFSGRDAVDVVGVVPPRMGIATIEAIAINAVMAGCLPEYMPLVVAGIEAILEEPFNLNGVQATTHMCAPLAMVSGPVVKRLNINAGTNCFGHGYRSNATIGRAIRLVMINLGGGHTETGDKATLGAPSKFTFCIGVDEDTPWEPLHVERGFQPEDSCITMFACEPPHSVGSGSASKGMLDVIASSMSSMGNNNVGSGGQSLVILNPMNAEALVKEGWTKQDVRYYLYHKARVPMSKFNALSRERQFHHIPERWPIWIAEAGDDFEFPVVREPENLHIAVAGGRNIPFNAVLPGWGYMGGYAVTKRIAEI